jgi:KDO2-lipid IV(A) lauroyltransferase
VNTKLNSYREKYGNEVIETGANLRQIYEKIKQKKVVAFLFDQSAPPEYSYFVKFFGIDTATYSGAAKMALKFNAEILFGVVVRKDDLNYSPVFIKIETGDLTGTFEEKAKEITARMNKTLENVIRSYPEQWLWFHRRFKNIKTNENQDTNHTDSIYR